MLRGFLLLAAAVACLADAPPSVPYTLVTITGTRMDLNSPASATYRAYQAAPSDGFRILCPQPCAAIPTDVIYAKYAGMKAARLKLMELVGGVDDVAEALPFDYHIQGDSFCGDYQNGLTGLAGAYASGATFGCFWDLEKPNQTYPLTAANAQRLEAQLLFVHEYTHTLFYNRHHISYEDLAKAFSIYVSGIDSVRPGQADFCDPGIGAFTPLIHELCQRNRFRPADFAPVMRELDRVFRAGQGTSYVGVTGKRLTSVHAFRRILDSHLGSNTRDAFLAVAFTPYQVGDDAIIPAAGGQVSLVGGAVVLDVPPGAVAKDTPLTLDFAQEAPTLPNLTFAQAFRLLPIGVTFTKPVGITVHYGPAKLEPSGHAESTLKFWKFDTAYSLGVKWEAVPNQRVDTVAHTVSGAITASGEFGYFFQ